MYLQKNLNVVRDSRFEVNIAMRDVVWWLILGTGLGGLGVLVKIGA